jgi:hypothetical protein
MKIIAWFILAILLAIQASGQEPRGGGTNKKPRGSKPSTGSKKEDQKQKATALKLVDAVEKKDLSAISQAVRSIKDAGANEAAVKRLAVVVRDEKTNDIRGLAIETMAKFLDDIDEEEITTIIGALRDRRSNNYVREAAARLLDKLDVSSSSDEAVAQMAQAVEDESNPPHVRVLVARTLILNDLEGRGRSSLRS